MAAAEFLEDPSFLYFVARGPSLAAAYQAALTFNEGARLPTCALSGGTFRHGPFELVGDGFAAVFFVPEGRTAEITGEMAREVAEAGGRVLMVTDGEAGDLPTDLRAMRLPRYDEALFALNACLPMELLLHEMARRRGRVAGVFERISKVTRRE